MLINVITRIKKDFSLPAAFAGFITFLIGISVSSVLVIQAGQVLGANQAQISSWFWALGLSIGLSGLILSWKFKYPVATSWSTAGLALIIATGSGYSLNEAIGAFLICGIMTAVMGYFGIFQRILEFLPQSLTSAMLAGVLLKFGITLFTVMQDQLIYVLILISTYFISKKTLPRHSIVITLLACIIVTPFFFEYTATKIHYGMTYPVWTQPEFHWSSILGLAIPLLIINMASQYLPGLAMIRSYGYQPHVNQLVSWTGIAQAIFAPFGAFSTNIAAISAAVSLDEQAHQDPAKRYIAGMACGMFYIFMGIFAATLTGLLLSFPKEMITTLAAIALFATIGHNISIAFKEHLDRDAALITFLMSASGVQFLGIGSAFWGLVIGFIIYHLMRIQIKKPI